VEKLAKLDGIDRINRHFLRAALAVAALMLVTLSIHGPCAFAGNWLHFGFDNQYTSYNPVEKTINVDNIGTLERKWGIGCNDGGFSVISRSPAVHNGRLYTSGAGSRLTAYNARTGKKLWQFGNGNAGWAPQPVVSQDGMVFYLEDSIPTYLYAVNGITGQMIWKAPLGFDLGFNDISLITVDEVRQLIYLIEVSKETFENGKLFALDKNTGEIIWYKSKSTDKIEFGGDYVLLNKNKIYLVGRFNSYLNHMISIDVSTNKLEIKYDRPIPEEYYEVDRYTIANDKLIVAFSDRADVFREKSLLAAYTLSSKEIKWTRRYPAITGKIAVNKTKNMIYVPTDPYLYALDVATGKVIWKYMGFGAIYNPSIANGIVYFISDTNMYALNESTGKKIFSYPLGYEGYETTQVAVNNGMLFFSGNGGDCDLFALGLPGEALPVVSLKATDASASEEGPDVGRFTVRRTGSTNAPLTVKYSVKGSAINGVDYAKLWGKITIQTGRSAASKIIKPVDDTLTENTEKVILDLVEDPSYTIGTPSSAVVNILDND
jgi:outer membrane protein assembly factor BamB